MFFNIGVLTNLVVFTGKGLKDCNFIKKRLQHRCFPVNIVKFLRTAFYTEHLRGCFCTLGTAELENIVRRNGKKHSQVGISNSITINEDHNIYTYSFFCLVVLAVENLRKPLLPLMYRNQVFLYFDFKLKSKKEKNDEKEKFHTLSF